MSQPGGLPEGSPALGQTHEAVTYGKTVSLTVNCIRIPGFENDIVPTQVGFSLGQNGEVPIEVQAIRAVYEQYSGQLEEFDVSHRGAHYSQAQYPDMFAYEKAMKQVEQERAQLLDRVACYRTLLAAVATAERADESAISFDNALASDAYHAIIEGIGILAYREPDSYNADALAEAVQFQDVRG